MEIALHFKRFDGFIHFFSITLFEHLQTKFYGDSLKIVT